MDRPIKEVVLPVSGVKAEVYIYYLRMERKNIEAVMLESAVFEEDAVTGKPRLKKVDTTYRARMEDKAVLLAIKKLTSADGKDMPVVVESLDSLPDEDFEVLQGALPSSEPKKK